MIQRAQSLIFFQPSVYYISLLGIIGLFIFTILIVLATSLVHENFDPVNLGTFLTNPGQMLSASIKKPVALEMIAPDLLNNTNRIKKHCNLNGCYVLLQSELYEINAEEIQSVSEPTKVTDNSGEHFAWIIPMQLSNDSQDLAHDVGLIIWDETRQIIIYEALANVDKQPAKLFVWEYTKPWSFGLLHWIDVRLPSSQLKVTGYDQKNGYISFDHLDMLGTDLKRKSFFAVSKPELKSVLK